MSSDFYDQHLRTFPSSENTVEQEQAPLLGSLPDLFRSFEQASGYRLRFVRAGGSFPEYRDSDVTADRKNSGGENNGSENNIRENVSVNRGRQSDLTAVSSETDLLETTEILKNTEVLESPNILLSGEVLRILRRYVVRDGERRVLGTLVLWQSADTAPHVTESMALAFAESLAAVIEESYGSALALRDREAELAAFSAQLYLSEEKFLTDKLDQEASKHTDGIAKEIKVSDELGSDESNSRFSRGLNDILKKTARLIGCDAASFYLLDNETSCLKLRAAWGIPEDRFTEPARPLRGSLADLEALLGSAVILNENYLAETWNPPECFVNSICVPVLSKNTVLGTLWFFSDRKKQFDDKDLAVLELTTRNIASELENILLNIEIRNYKKSK